ncbi:hypothetical protein FS749_014971, partial [Ceratobasidium sp. UAMH 11750]
MESDSEPDSDLETCFCCGERFSSRQIRRHRTDYLKQLGSAVAREEAPDDAGVAPDDTGAMALNDLGPAPGEDWGLNAGDVVGGDDITQGDPPGHAGDMSVLEDDSPAPPRQLPPGRGLRRNPPVTIEEWPDPDASSVGSAFSDDESIDDADRDPPFVERDEPLGFHPDDEPGIDDEIVREFFNLNLGDLAEDEWIDLYDRFISDKDHESLKFLATRLRTHFSRQTYDDLRHGVCEPLNLPSEFIAWRRLRILSGLETHAYDCCVNSCCCYLGKYKDLDSCPFCKEPRYTPAGRTRRVFHYTPLIPQLQGLFQSADMVEKLGYRVQAEALRDPDKIQDVFDAEHYRTLRDPDGDFRLFTSPTDIALGLSTDGFSLYKRRHRGCSTAWPIILINYNLHPRIQTRLENVICVGVIPGPKQCKDLNSFLIPLLEELLKLEAGVDSSRVAAAGDVDARGSYFVLRAFLIMLFGDIPAVAKLLAMKGHNAIVPCRACYHRGTLCRLAKNSVYYMPLTAPNANALFPPDLLFYRTHDLFLHDLNNLDTALNKTERKKIARDCGINSRSIFARLKSINLAHCAPYDIMHLLFENLVPNLIRHWTGNFKGLDEGTGNYRLSPADWATIGRLSAAATRTVPSAFVGTIPDIAEDGHLYKAEAYSFWFQFIAPVVLKDRLPEPYYEHFLRMREIFIWVIHHEITMDQITELERMVNEWVADYERLYYQYKQTRLPTCPLTIHALLHLPFYIRQTGPLWASWAFVMERFCGHLLVPAMKNRVRPYEHLDNYVQRRAQMQVVSRLYDLPWLAKSRIQYTHRNGEKMSSRETMYPG